LNVRLSFVHDGQTILIFSRIIVHRGTYTSHGSIKRGNRKSENLLREIERAATLASIRSNSYDYPSDGLDELWHGGENFLQDLPNFEIRSSID
jgi:alpha-mannosidase